jgi:1-acyl-sn-glycerol-3-phosphate acyltransferase
MLYAGYLWILILVLGVAALPVMLLPRMRWRRRFARFMTRAVLRISRLPVSLRGIENFPREGAVTVVANHSSYLDSLLMFALLPERCSLVAKRELGEIIGLGRLLRAIGVRLIERSDIERGAEDTRDLVRLATHGESLVFFPEGTFTRAPGLRPFRMGAFVVSAGAGTPVLPVAVRGTRSVLRDGQWFPRWGSIRIFVSPPIEPEGKDWAAAVELRDRARAEILARCGEPDLVPS